MEVKILTVLITLAFLFFKLLLSCI
jgi:hypothetical protein